MSNKVSKLARKLALKSIFAHDNEAFRLQRERLAQFSFEMNRKLSAIANEMEGDLFTLREKGFPSNELKELNKIRQEVLALRKELDTMKPYESAKLIINKVNDRMFRAHINTLEVIIQHFLKKNEVDTATGSKLHQARVDSLKLLVDFSHSLAAFMSKHPLLPDPVYKMTMPPPRPTVIQDTKFDPGTPEGITNPDKK